jgi:D-alanyl-D-alanine endopeptidase (penicillin-binding protein 7)
MKRFLVILIFLLCVNAYARPVEAYILYNVDDAKVVASKNPNDIGSVASLTKLMTAMVYLDYTKKIDRRLLDRLLIRSDNQAAMQIAKQYPGGYNAFIRAMNNKASKMGLIDTKYKDPSGLHRYNTSTVTEYIKIVMEADKYSIIREISSTTEKRIPIVKRIKHRKKTYYKTLRNTNSLLLNEYDNIELSKTGFTNDAGRCLALVVEGTKKHVIVIFGEPTPTKREDVARELISMIK